MDISNPLKSKQVSEADKGKIKLMTMKCFSFWLCANTNILNNNNSLPEQTLTNQWI